MINNLMSSFTWLNSFSAKGDWTSLAVGQGDGGIAIWNISSSGDVKPRHSQLLWGHPGQPVHQLKFHPGGDLLASVSSSSSQGELGWAGLGWAGLFCMISLSQQIHFWSHDSNPGLLIRKRDCYHCAMTPFYHIIY